MIGHFTDCNGATVPTARLKSELRYYVADIEGGNTSPNLSFTDYLLHELGWHWTDSRTEAGE